MAEPQAVQSGLEVPGARRSPHAAAAAAAAAAVCPRGYFVMALNAAQCGGRLVGAGSLDGDLALLMKRLLKKDVTTKVKALQVNPTCE